MGILDAFSKGIKAGREEIIKERKQKYEAAKPSPAGKAVGRIIERVTPATKKTVAGARKAGESIGKALDSLPAQKPPTFTKPKYNPPSRHQALAGPTRPSNFVLGRPEPGLMDIPKPRENKQVIEIRHVYVNAEKKAKKPSPIPNEEPPHSWLMGRGKYKS